MMYFAESSCECGDIIRSMSYDSIEKAIAICDMRLIEHRQNHTLWQRVKAWWRR